MRTETSTHTGRTLTRPLHVLVPTIAEGLKRVKQNVHEIGKAMAEARGQMSYAAFSGHGRKRTSD